MTRTLTWACVYCHARHVLEAPTSRVSCACGAVYSVRWDRVQVETDGRRAGR
jgi:hypothetical protein